MEEFQTGSSAAVNGQYLKYGDSFKKQCVLNVAAGVCILIGALLLLFVPVFEIDLLIVKVNFSFFDEIKLTFQSFTGGVVSGDGAASDSGWYGATFTYFGFFQIMAIVFFAVGIVWMLVDVVKNCLGIVNVDTYALQQYDKIKTRAAEGRSRRFRGVYSPGYFIVSGIMSEMFYVIFVKVFSNIPGVGSDDGFSNFLSITGVSWTVIFPLLFIAAYITFWAMKKYMFNQVKTAILKEDYNIK